MSKFNRIVNISSRLLSRDDATTNYEDAIAFELSPELTLYKMTCTNLVSEDKFYEAGETADANYLTAINAVEDSKFLLSLANFTRNEMHLRSVPVLLLAEAIKRDDLRHDGKSKIREYCPKILKRPDECCELLAYWLNVEGKPIPNSLKRGIRDSLSKFDQYQIAKYRNDDKDVSLSDVVRLCARDLIEEDNCFHKLVKGELKQERTWESTLSEKGNTKTSWEEILPNMGIMAVIRNLRNMLQQDVPVKNILAKFTDKAILNSKQLPFRWYSALKALIGVLSSLDQISVRAITDKLRYAMELSCQNVEKLKGRTLIAIDHSGSMDAVISEKSTVLRFETGAVLGALADKICDQAIVGLFGTTWKIIMPSSDILSTIATMTNTDVGHSTNAYLAIEWALKQDKPFDRILIFTDEQVYDTSGRASLAERLIRYRNKVNKNVKTYIFDLAGYSTSCMPEDANGVTLLAGFSDKALKLISLSEEEDMIERIKNNY